MSTFKEVVNDLKRILSSNPLYNECREGNIWEFDTKVIKFPVTWIDCETNNHLINDSSITYNIDVFWVDLVYSNETNELNIKNDTLESAIDFTIFLKNNRNSLNFYVKDGSYSAQVFSEKFDERVAGTKLSLIITVKGAGSSCKNIYNL